MVVVGCLWFTGNALCWVIDLPHTPCVLMLSPPPVSRHLCPIYLDHLFDCLRFTSSQPSSFVLPSSLPPPVDFPFITASTPALFTCIIWPLLSTSLPHLFPPVHTSHTQLTCPPPPPPPPPSLTYSKRLPIQVPRLTCSSPSLLE